MQNFNRAIKRPIQNSSNSNAMCVDEIAPSEFNGSFNYVHPNTTIGSNSSYFPDRSMARPPQDRFDKNASHNDSTCIGYSKYAKRPRLGETALMPIIQHKQPLQTDGVFSRKPVQNNSAGVQQNTSVNNNVAIKSGSNVGRGVANATKQFTKTVEAEIHPTRSSLIKSNYLEPVRFLTGNIDNVIKWHKLLQAFCHYEVIAPVIAIQGGLAKMQNRIILKDRKGPALILLFYVYDRIDLPNFYLGQTIRCTGRMIADNTLQAICIREITPSEVSCLRRLYYICDQEVRKLLLD